MTLLQSSKLLFASHKLITHGMQSKARLLAGCDKLADAVQVTMGPKGRHVIIEQPSGYPKITKDGVTVAKSISLEDPIENAGASLLKQVASKANDIAGDGTTTATVLARAIFREGSKAVAAGVNPMDVKRGIDWAVGQITSDLTRKSKIINTSEEIYQVALIAANGDTVVGRLIADAMDKVTCDGVISIQNGSTHHHVLEVEPGMKIDRGFLSPWFVTNQATGKVEYDDALVLIVEKKISTIRTLLPALELAHKAGKPLLIIAEDVEGEALHTLCVNRARVGLQVVAVKAPHFGEHRKNVLHDLALATGTTVISEDLGMKVEQVTMESFGKVKRVECSNDKTILFEGAGAKEEVAAKCDEIRSGVDHATNEYEKDKLKERLASLTRGVAVIKVGGNTEVEMQEIKDRLVDALHATRAAVESGIVSGGGTAFLHSSKMLPTLADLGEGRSFDHQVGVDAVRRAVQIPCHTICKNAGQEGSVIVEKIMQEESERFGYNAQTNEYVDMFEAGIIDPTKVVKTALEDAASIAGLMITSEAIVTEAPKKLNSNPAAHLGNGLY